MYIAYIYSNKYLFIGFIGFIGLTPDEKHTPDDMESSNSHPGRTSITQKVDHVCFWFAELVDLCGVCQHSESHSTLYFLIKVSVYTMYK